MSEEQEEIETVSNAVKYVAVPKDSQSPMPWEEMSLDFFVDDVMRITFKDNFSAGDIKIKGSKEEYEDFDHTPEDIIKVMKNGNKILETKLYLSLPKKSRNLVNYEEPMEVEYDEKELKKDSDIISLLYWNYLFTDRSRKDEMNANLPRILGTARSEGNLQELYDKITNLNTINLLFSKCSPDFTWNNLPQKLKQRLLLGIAGHRAVKIVVKEEMKINLDDLKGLRKYFLFMCRNMMNQAPILSLHTGYKTMALRDVGSINQLCYNYFDRFKSERIDGKDSSHYVSKYYKKFVPVVVKFKKEEWDEAVRKLALIFVEDVMTTAVKHKILGTPSKMDILRKIILDAKMGKIFNVKDIKKEKKEKEKKEKEKLEKSVKIVKKKESEKSMSYLP